jgi:hypothetical protein
MMQRVTYVGVNSLARDVNLPPKTVSNMMRAGKTVEQIRAFAAQRHGTTPVPPIPEKAVAEKETPRSEYEMVIAAAERTDALESAKLRRARALAEKQEIENMVRRGELLPVGYVSRWAAKFLVDGRDELLRLPSELADSLASETEPLKIRAVLEAAMLRVLAKWENINRILNADLDAQKVA